MFLWRLSSDVLPGPLEVWPVGERLCTPDRCVACQAVCNRFWENQNHASIKLDLQPLSIDEEYRVLPKVIKLVEARKVSKRYKNHFKNKSFSKCKKTQMQLDTCLQRRVRGNEGHFSFFVQSTYCARMATIRLDGALRQKKFSACNKKRSYFMA